MTAIENNTKTLSLYQFTEDGNAFVIRNTKPPRYWYNYLWNENGYCSHVSQIGHGKSYYINERADMCMINQNDAKYIYLRDEEDGICWNVGEGPLNEDVEEYQCTHSIGYSRLFSRKKEIQSSWRIFVPEEGFHEASVLEHVKAAVNRLIADKGRNGLVRIYFADWNDALNITTDQEAESVMLSHQFCLALLELRQLMEEAGDQEYAKFLAAEYEILKKRINEAAWDGDWYVRALSKEEVIGSQKSEGSRIYLNAQTWAVLAQVPDEDKLPRVLKAVDDMEHDFGLPLNMPPYQSYSPHVGRMSGMLPGLFENGGVYCHATGFKILMDCKAGRAAKAVETLKKIMPDSNWNPSMLSGAEPYVFTNCYSTHPKYYGKSYQS